jgi:mRNA interferase RelE/StbE
MKAIRILPGAAKALRKHKADAERILSRIEAYASSPESQRNNVIIMKGGFGRRLRVGDYRVIFEETADEIVVTKIGPRGGIYD